MSHYDVIIIGAGMSGLAAGVRLALFGKKVLLLERHSVVGGLNSFYSLQGRKYDVGLHAITNFCRPDDRRAPLYKLLRQLDLPYAALDLNPQKGSRISFPGVDLRFNNQLETLESDIIQLFPGQIDGFRRLVEAVRQANPFDLNAPWVSTRALLPQFIKDPLLIEMILCPLFYYGGAQEGDMDFYQFVILFRAIFLEGFARPYEGIRPLLHLLVGQFRQLGGERRMRCGVERLEAQNGRVQSVVLEGGEVLTATHVLSSIGLVETMRLCSDQPAEAFKEDEGQMTFVETITVFDRPTAQWGWDETIVFFSKDPRFCYQKPQGMLVDPTNGVLCCPSNYEFSGNRTLPEGLLRVTARANCQEWMRLPQEQYMRAKGQWFQILYEMAMSVLPKTLPANVLLSYERARDMFTPRTVIRYTGRVNGNLYGSPRKVRTGRTHLNNLYLCGSDQGFLGIVGAMLSGVTVANMHVLAGTGGAAAAEASQAAAQALATGAP